VVRFGARLKKMDIRTGLNRKGFGGSCDYLSVTSWIVYLYKLHHMFTSYKTDNLISFNVPIIEEVLSQLLLVLLHLLYFLLNITLFPHTSSHCCFSVLNLQWPHFQ
jgi:hypothetical protein